MNNLWGLETTLQQEWIAMSLYETAEGTSE